MRSQNDWQIFAYFEAQQHLVMVSTVELRNNQWTEFTVLYKVSQGDVSSYCATFMKQPNFNWYLKKIN